VEYPTPLRASLTGPNRDTWDRATAYYKSAALETSFSLPVRRGGLVDFSTALPDDEMLIDRLGLPPNVCTRVWLSMLEEAHTNGELLTILLHPERITEFASGLRALLRHASELRGGVWIASLGEIARWWLRRTEATLRIQPIDGGWSVSVAGANEVTIECLGGQASWAPAYGQGSLDRKLIAVRAWPGIGVGGAAADALCDQVRALGFAAEVRRPDREYAIRLESAADEQLVSILRQLARGRADQPAIMRLGLWPRGHRSALAITGDICALTYGDFIRRFLG
jgi:hypothetical protein